MEEQIEGLRLCLPSQKQVSYLLYLSNNISVIKEDKDNLTNNLAFQFKNIAEMKGLRNAIDTIIKLSLLEARD